MVRKRQFLVITDIPRLVLGESCTKRIKDFAIFTPHKKICQFPDSFKRAMRSL